MAADRKERLPLNTDEVPPAYVTQPDAEARELSAIRLAQAALATHDLVPPHRDATLALAVDLFIASRAGPFAARFRTPAVMNLETPAPVRLHHVRPRGEVIAELIAGGAELVPLILPQATACLVTDAEYRRLEAISQPLTPWQRGWDRYAAAGLAVVDRGTARSSTRLTGCCRPPTAGTGSNWRAWSAAAPRASACCWPVGFPSPARRSPGQWRRSGATPRPSRGTGLRPGRPAPITGVRQRVSSMPCRR